MAKSIHIRVGIIIQHSINKADKFILNDVLLMTHLKRSFLLRTLGLLKSIISALKIQEQTQKRIL